MDNQTALDKQSVLVSILKQCESVLVAFSGGVDSSFLLYTAFNVLGREKVLAVTADSETYPFREMRDAVMFSLKYGIRHKFITTCEIRAINKQGNMPDRCYHCKKELFTRLVAKAARRGYAYVLDGSNADDACDYRPGARAIDELKVRSPFKEAALTKEDIRFLSREAGLATWDKPAFACLASRFPYYTEIDPGIVKKIEKAEEYLNQLGFRQCRVRYFNDRVSVEVEKARVDDALLLKEKISDSLKQIGFDRIEIDPDGYRMGRMNEFIKK